MSLNDILNKAIGSMSPNTGKKIVIDLSNFFEYYNPDSMKAKNTDGLYDLVNDKLSFINENILSETLNKAFNFNAANLPYILKELVKTYPNEFSSIRELVVTNTKFTDKTMFKAVVEHDKLLSEIGDFSDEYMCKVVSRVKSTLVVSKTVLGKDMPIRLDDSHVYYIYMNIVLDLDNIKDVPKGLMLTTPITLHNNVIHETIRATEGTAIITLNGDTTIDCNLPIDVTGCETLIIKGEGTLTLESGEHQPCIGSKTDTGLSYGRWSLGKEFKCKRICISGVNVILNPGVPYFTIGRYGTNEMIDIEVWNGGRINAPELTGQRVIVQQALPPIGSTKISESMVYGIK